MLLCMRTTIQLDDLLLTEVKKYALKSGRTLKSIIEDALRETISRQHNQVPKKTPVKLKTVKGDGLQPGVDLNDSAALLDIMES